MADFKTVGNLATKATDTAANTAKNAGKVINFEEAKSTLNDLRSKSEEINSVRRDGNEYMDGQVAEGFEVGERVAPGRVVGKDGTVEKSATNEVIGAAASVIPMLFTGGGSEVGKQAGKEIVKDAAKETAKGAGKEAAKTTAKEAGALAAKEAGKDAAKGAATAAGKAAAKEGTKAAEKAATRNAIRKGFNANLKPGGKGLMDLAGDAINSTQITKDTLKKGAELIGKASGDLADKLDKVPGVKQVNKYYVGDAAKAVNSTFDAFGNLLNFDFGDMFSNLWKAIKGLFKFTSKTLFLYIALQFAITAIPILVIVLPIVFAVFPSLHFFDTTTSDISQSEIIYSTNAYSSMYGAGLYMDEAIKAVIDDVPDFDGLSNGRKVLVVAGAAAIGTPATGGKPTDPTVNGIISGISPGGLLEWAIWNVTGSDPGEFNVNNLGSNSNLVSISESSLKPGDIGTDGLTVGIYMGNNTWVYVDTGSGVLRGNYYGFTSFFSVKDIDTISVIAGDGGGGGAILPAPNPGDSLTVRERVLYFAAYFLQLHVPYASDGPGNITSMDVNGNGFFRPVGNASDLFGKSVSGFVIKGFDCCRYTGYVYSLAIGSTTPINFCAYLHTSIPGFQEISVDDLQPGDVIDFQDVRHHAIFIRREGNNLITYESGGWSDGKGLYFNYDEATNSFVYTTADNLRADGKWVHHTRVGVHITPYSINGSHKFRYWRYIGG